MEDKKLSFFSRFFLAFGVFFRLLGDAAFAGRVSKLRGLPAGAEPAEGDLAKESAAPPAAKEPAAPPAAKEPASAAPKLREAPTDAALQLLALLQREGRLLDFLSEDVSSFSDAEVGAAARLVHDDCARALAEHVTIERVRPEAEGSRLTLEAGFDARAVRLIGDVIGQAPFTGTLAHAGYRASRVELPMLSEGHDVTVLAPAEVEL